MTRRPGHERSRTWYQPCWSLISRVARPGQHAATRRAGRVRCLRRRARTCRLPSRAPATTAADQSDRRFRRVRVRRRDDDRTAERRRVSRPRRSRLGTHLVAVSPPVVAARSRCFRDEFSAISRARFAVSIRSTIGTDPWNWTWNLTLSIVPETRRRHRVETGNQTSHDLELGVGLGLGVQEPGTIELRTSSGLARLLRL